MNITENQKLISENLGLVHSCARRFCGRGVDYDDLFQAGCVGLCKAAGGFDGTLGFCFSTYAVPAILGEIKRIFRDGGSVKVSRSMKERALNVQKQKEMLTARTGEEPTVHALAASLGLSCAETAELLLVSVPPVSLSVCDGDGDDVRQFDIPVSGESEKSDEIISLDYCIKALDECDRRLLELRYFGGLTQSAAAKKLGMSQVQVSRREKVILKILREKMTL